VYFKQCLHFKLEAFSFETQNYCRNIGADILLIGVQSIYYSIVEIRSSWPTVFGLARMSAVLCLLHVNLNSFSWWNWCLYLPWMKINSFWLLGCWLWETLHFQMFIPLVSKWILCFWLVSGKLRLVVRW